MVKLSPLTQKLIKDFQRRKKILIYNKSNKNLNIKSRQGKLHQKLMEKAGEEGKINLIKSAIKKDLQKSILHKNSITENARESAKSIIIRLIHLGYLKKGTLNDESIDKLENVINKYVYISRHSPYQQYYFRKWIILIAAYEMTEELLSPSKKEIVSYYMFNSIKNSVEINQPIPEQEKNFIVYLAVQKNIFNLDKSSLSYYALKFIYPNWKTIDNDELGRVVAVLYRKKKQIVKSLNSPLFKKISRLCYDRCVPYIIIGDLVERNPEKAQEILSNPEQGEKNINICYSQKWTNKEKELYRKIIYSTIIIFIINFVVFLVFSVPYFAHTPNELFAITSLMFAVLFPPFLMIIMGITTPLSINRNKNMLILEALNIIYQKEEQEKLPTINANNKSIFVYFLISTIYFVSFVFLSFSIIWLLYIINFSLWFCLAFIIYLSIISYIAKKIRKDMQRIYVTRTNEGFWGIIINILSFPITWIERRVASDNKKCNNFSVMISAMLKMQSYDFMQIIQGWKIKLKEKKEKLY